MVDSIIKMESKRDWNDRKQQNMVRNDGCGAVSHRTLEGYEEQFSSAHLPWIQPFTNNACINPPATSSLVSHRNGASSGTEETSDDWGIKNKVTPPSGAVKIASTENAYGNQLGAPPPLLLSKTDPIFNSTVGESSITARNATQQLSSLPTKKGVPHVYHDFSNVPDAVGVVRKKTGGVTQPFPEKLHTMLENVEDTSTVSWLSHGRAFLVRRPTEFTSKIMPRYFRQTKLTSFQRQLNLYGFRRLTQGADSGAYYHELFLKGRPQLCLRMQRQKIKGTGHKQPADVQTEPNFYNMPTPNQTELAIGFSPPSPPQITVAPRESSFCGMSLAHMSPASRGMHGAAHLLKDMKSTNSSMEGKSSMLELSLSLDQSATTLAIACKEPKHQYNYRALSPTSSLSTIQSSIVGSSPVVPSNELFAIPKDRSMSLLGRVQNFPKHRKRNSSSSEIVDASSAFFWPPRKSTTESSSSQTTAIFESSVTSSPSPHHSQLTQRK